MTTSIQKLKIVLVSIAIMTASVLSSNPAAATTGTTTGVTFSWPDLVFAPQSSAEQSTNAFDLNYSNNSGKDFYYIGYSLDTPEGKPLAGDFAFGVKNGTSGKIRIMLSYLSFLNFTGPANYSFNLCTLIAIGDKETCSKGILVIKKKESNDVASSNSQNVPTAASGASLTVMGVTVTWPENIYIPDSTNFPLLISFSNNSGKDILKAEWVLKDGSGNTIASRSVIGLKNKGTGYETGNVIQSSFKSGPGAYRVIVRVEGYDGSGTLQDERSIQIPLWSQNLQKPFSSSLVAGNNSLTLNGFTFTWPANLTVPAEGNNVGVEIQFANKTGMDILSAELMLVDYKGSRIFDRSVIGLKSGTSSIQEDNTITSSYPLGAGIYKIVATVEDYNGRYGAMGTAYVEVKAAPGPPQAISDLSAARSTNSIDYKFTKPSSYSPISEYAVVIQALLAPGIDPASYSSYGAMNTLKYFYAESFSLTSLEIKNFLIGKVPDPANTSVMVRVQAHSSNGWSYLSNGIYTQTRGFITQPPVVVTKTIYCKKGTAIKSVTGTSPVCPSGYKKIA